MKPHEHLILGGIASAALVPVLGPNSIAFGAASVLIDTDHYLEYAYRTGFRDFSLRRAVRWYNFLIPLVQTRPFIGLSVFHTVEALAAVATAAFVTNYSFVWAILWGMLFHWAIDDLADLHKYKTIRIRAHSLVEYVVRWNLMKKRGEEPEAVYKASLEELRKHIEH